MAGEGSDSGQAPRDVCSGRCLNHLHLCGKSLGSTDHRSRATAAFTWPSRSSGRRRPHVAKTFGAFAREGTGWSGNPALTANSERAQRDTRDTREPRLPTPRETPSSHSRGSHAHPRPGGRAAATPAGAGAQRHSAYHEVLDAVAELVDEEDREVVHRLPQLDPGGEAVLHVTVRPRLR